VRRVATCRLSSWMSVCQLVSVGGWSVLASAGVATMSVMRSARSGGFHGRLPHVELIPLMPCSSV
jgi:hypothetical protein